MKSSIKIATLSTLLLGANLAFFAGCAATPTTESTGQFVDDATITTRVKAAFVNDEVVKARAVSVETYKGIVQLSGFVNTPVEKARAEEIAAGIKGVRSVKNSIAIK